MKSKRRNLNSATKLNKEPKLSRTHAPADLSPLDWQRGLRRQFGREQAFGLENLSSEPFFSEFQGQQSCFEIQLSRGDSRLGARGQFLFMPRIMPPANWAPASTSNSRSPGWRKSAARRRRLRGATSPHFPSCICAMTANAVCIFVPERIARPR